MKFTDEQFNKIKGVFYGQAIGDALGLGTEFMTKSEVKHHYPNGLTYYEQIIQDNHRSRWKKGSWTDDTDLFLCIVDAILKSKSCDELLIARNFKQLFNVTPLGIGSNMYKVLSYPQYESNPTKASEMIWKLSNRKNASNGAAMRTSILGVFDFHNAKNVIQNAEKVARLNHFDPRCVGSSVIVSLVIAQLIRNNEFPSIQELK